MFCFCDGVSCRPDWPGTHYIVEVGSELLIILLTAGVIGVCYCTWPIQCWCMLDRHSCCTQVQPLNEQSQRHTYASHCMEALCLNHVGSGERAQRVKVLAAKLDRPEVDPQTHMKARRDCCGLHTPLSRDKQIHVIKMSKTSHGTSDPGTLGIHSLTPT